MADRKYIDIPGSVTHELPPLLVHSAQEGRPLSEVVGMAAGIVEAEDMLGEMPADESLLAHITRTGKRYHREGCRYLASSKIPTRM